MTSKKKSTIKTIKHANSCIVYTQFISIKFSYRTLLITLDNSSGYFNFLSLLMHSKFLILSISFIKAHLKMIAREHSRFFDKAATNAFHGTGLLDYLKAEQISHLVIMGCETQYCIDTAVRTATVSGFDVTLVSDGHSTAGNHIISSEEIIQHHNVTLHGFDNVEHFSLVRESNEDIFSPLHDSYR